MIVMTGITRGIGHMALGHLQAIAGARLVAGVRGDGPPGVTCLPLDLASLASVNRFADTVLALPDARPIATLLLNAGGQRPNVEQRSVDGHELSFAANHLGHFLLLDRLLPHMAPGGRIVITSSGTHDPAQATGVPPPHHANARWLADPAIDPHRDRNAITAGMRAYAASKLCNLMTARHVAGLPTVQARQISVVAYDPGLTPGTGLVRDQMWVVRALVWPLLPLFVRRSRQMNTLTDAGRHLALLAHQLRPPTGHVYAALRKGQLGWPEPSLLASDDAACAALWRDSRALCGLPAD